MIPGEYLSACGLLSFEQWIESLCGRGQKDILPPHTLYNVDSYVEMALRGELVIKVIAERAGISREEVCGDYTGRELVPRRKEKLDGVLIQTYGTHKTFVEEASGVSWNTVRKKLNRSTPISGRADVNGLKVSAYVLFEFEQRYLNDDRLDRMFSRRA